MQQIAIINNARLAQAFVDYMATKQVVISMSSDPQGVALWLADDEQLTFTQAQWQEFVKDPMARKYQQASWEIGDRKSSPLQYASSSSEIKTRFLAHSGPFTLLMIAAIVLVYILGMIFPVSEIRQAFYFPIHFAQLAQAPWRLITPIFLHFSLMHILFNLLWWWEFGGIIERQIGTSKLVIVTIVAAVIPNFMQFWLVGPYFGGLSGVVYALLGYLWLSSKWRPSLGMTLNPMIVIFMLVWLGLGFILNVAAQGSALLPQTANWAHLFGLLVGCAQAVFERFTDKDIS